MSFDVTDSTAAPPPEPQDAADAPPPVDSIASNPSVIHALVEHAGRALGQVIASWIEDGIGTTSTQVLMGPAGTTALVTIRVESVNPVILGKAGRA